MAGAKPAPKRPPDVPVPSTELELAIAKVMQSLQPGDVLSYGDVAAEAGNPGAARAVGRFLRVFEGYPWWRVVNAKGRLVPGNEVLQAKLLAKEGVATKSGHVVAG